MAHFTYLGINLSVHGLPAIMTEFARRKNRSNCRTIYASFYKIARNSALISIQAANGSHRLLSVLDSIDKLESGPNFIDCTDFDLHQIVFQTDIL